MLISFSCDTGVQQFSRGPPTIPSPSIRPGFTWLNTGGCVETYSTDDLVTARAMPSECMCTYNRARLAVNFYLLNYYMNCYY